MKRLFSFAAVAAVTAAMLFPAQAIAAKKVTLKLGHNAATNHHYHKLSVMFQEAVAKASGGEIEIKVFPNDQLGSQRQLVEGAQLGTTDIVLTSDSVLSNFEDTFAALIMPFLFRDMDHVGKVMDGPIGEEFRARAAKKGMFILAFWENGFRAVSNSKLPILTAKDMEGLKIRISPGFLSVDMFKALGSLPTPMATGEVYSALQLGTVDGQENSPTFVLSHKYYEVQKYLSITNHQHNTEPLVISKMIYDGLKPEHRKILREEAQKLAPLARQMVVDVQDQLLKELEGKIAINIVTDYSTFEQASQQVYDKYNDKYGDLVRRIKAVQ